MTSQLVMCRFTSEFVPLDIEIVFYRLRMCDAEKLQSAASRGLAQVTMSFTPLHHSEL